MGGANDVTIAAARRGSGGSMTMTGHNSANPNGGSSMKDRSVEIICKVLDRLNIELPSWGFANTGTRFGKFIQPAAATSIEEKFSDAAQVRAVTGACPTLALHV